MEEIEAKAEEEFNIEKSRLVSQQRIKIIEYFDRKEKQIELQKKIQHSNLSNSSRLSILKARDDYVQNLKQEAEKQLKLLTEDRTKYRTLLLHLILQGVLLLVEKQIQIRCQYEDQTLIKELIPIIITKYQEQFHGNYLQINIDEKHFLSKDSFVLICIFSFNEKRLFCFLESVALNFTLREEKFNFPIPFKHDSTSSSNKLFQKFDKNYSASMKIENISINYKKFFFFSFQINSFFMLVKNSIKRIFFNNRANQKNSS